MLKRKIYVASIEILYRDRERDDRLTGNIFTETLTNKKKESLVTALYFGSIFIILALVFVFNSGIWDRLVDFFSSLTLAQVPGTSISLPAPVFPASHIQLYAAVFQFSIGVGILEIVVLAVRILLRSPLARKAETIENMVFWLGTSYLSSTYLAHITLETEWFVFWAGMILIAGLSLVTRGFILLAGRKH